MEELKKVADIQPGDIIFECPTCGKSLAIDPRGAGFTVTCPDCNAQVQVPTSDEDAVDISNIEQLRERIEELEILLSQNRAQFEKIGKEIVMIQAALDRITAALE